MPFINRCGGMINNFITGEFTGLGEDVYENGEWIYADEYTIENVYLPGGQLNGFCIWLQNQADKISGIRFIISSGESIANGVCYTNIGIDQNQGNIRNIEVNFTYDVSAGTLHLDRTHNSSQGVFLAQTYQYIIW